MKKPALVLVAGAATVFAVVTGLMTPKVAQADACSGRDVWCEGTCHTVCDPLHPDQCWIACQLTKKLT